MGFRTWHGHTLVSTHTCMRDRTHSDTCWYPRAHVCLIHVHQQRTHALKHVHTHACTLPSQCHVSLLTYTSTHTAVLIKISMHRAWATSIICNTAVHRSPLCCAVKDRHPLWAIQPVAFPVERLLYKSMWVLCRGHYRERLSRLYLDIKWWNTV